jgi:hypothetical protein
MERTRILFLSANPWTTSRILVDEEAREVFEKLQEGPHRNNFELFKHSAIRAIDLQRLVMMYQPHIVHFSGHGSKSQKLILGGTPGRGKEVDRQGLVEVFSLYKSHVRLVLLNACFTRVQARSLSEVIDYSVGTGKGIGDKAGVAFAGAFYRALGFGKSVKGAFESAKAELGLTKMPRTNGIELFVRQGIGENDPFPQLGVSLKRSAGQPRVSARRPLSVGRARTLQDRTPQIAQDMVFERTEERSESKTTVSRTSRVNRSISVRLELRCYSSRNS